MANAMECSQSWPSLDPCLPHSQAPASSLHPRYEGLDHVQAELEVRRSLEATWLRAIQAAIADTETMIAERRQTEAQALVRSGGSERAQCGDDGSDHLGDSFEEHRRREWCASCDGRPMETRTVSVEMVRKEKPAPEIVVRLASDDLRGGEAAREVAVVEPVQGDDEEDDEKIDVRHPRRVPPWHCPQEMQVAQFSWPHSAPSAVVSRPRSLTCLGPTAAPSAPKRHQLASSPRHEAASPVHAWVAPFRRDMSPLGSRHAGSRSPVLSPVRPRTQSPIQVRQPPLRSLRPMSMCGGAVGGGAENGAQCPGALVRPRRTQGSLGAPPSAAIPQAGCTTPQNKAPPNFVASQGITPSDKHCAPMRTARTAATASSRAVGVGSLHVADKSVPPQPARLERQPLAERHLQIHSSAPCTERGPLRKGKEPHRSDGATPTRAKGERRQRRPPQIEVPSATSTAAVQVAGTPALHADALQSYSYAPPPFHATASFVPPARNSASYVPTSVAIVSYKSPAASVSATVSPVPTSAGSPVGCMGSSLSSPAASTPITPVYGLPPLSGRSPSAKVLPPAVQAAPASWGMPS